MRDLVRFLRQRLVVVFARGVGIEPEVELILNYGDSAFNSKLNALSP